MKHFICTGSCDGEASNPGVCQTEDCKKEGEPLISCDCEDGLHKEAEKEAEGTE